MNTRNPQVRNSPLGNTVAYVEKYTPDLLYPIPRPPRDFLPDGKAIYGVDIWNAYEISWLNTQGVPNMALGEFRIPFNSPNIVESKSFKLYLNSFNQSTFASRAEVISCMQNDLQKAIGASVQVTLFGLNQEAMPLRMTPGELIDNRPIETIEYQPNAKLLGIHASSYRQEILHSHLLKTNCPVTGQPDWATLVIDYEGITLDRSKVLEYIISYRQHDDFHEQCVEQIFKDIMQTCAPQQLTVYARYTRRGGLDINPYRSTQPINPANCRSERQ